MKAQDRHAALLRAIARGREVVEQQLLAKHGVDGFGKRRALARTELAVVAEEPRNDLVGRVIEFQDKADQIGGGLQQGFGVHPPIVSAAALPAPKGYAPRVQTAPKASRSMSSSFGE
nr:hypothetical protein [Variovorax sp. YR266]